MKTINWKKILTGVSGTTFLFALFFSWVLEADQIAKIFYFISIFSGGYYVVQGAWRGLLKQRFLNIDFLVIIAAVGAIYINQLAEAAAVVFFFSLAEAFERFGIDRSKKALEALIKKAPQTATLKNGRQIKVEHIKIKEFAEKYLAKDKCSAHNIDHVMRVYNLAMKLAKNKKVDLEVIQAAILLHDIEGIKEKNDITGKTCHAVESAKIARRFLKRMGYSEDKINHIAKCIVSHRYRTNNKPETLEAKIVFDADKLETLGAIGLARAFVWVGKNNAHI